MQFEELSLNVFMGMFFVISLKCKYCTRTFVEIFLTIKGLAYNYSLNVTLYKCTVYYCMNDHPAVLDLSN